MRCDEAITAILEADRSELNGEGTGSLATHVRTCPRCGALAQKVIREQDALSRALADHVPAMDLDALLVSSADKEIPPPPVSFPKWRRLALTLAPLAAAAALAVLLYHPQPDLPGEPYRAAPGDVGLGLETPDDARVAVLPTKNPQITVLWFF